MNHDTDPNLFALRYRLKDLAFEAAEEPFEAAGRKFNRGSFLLKGGQAADIQKAAAELGLQAARAALGARR